MRKLKYKPVVAVDFDGTLCQNAWPNIGPPRKGVIEYVKRHRENGDRIILWTNRTGNLLDEAVDWCADEGITFDAVNENIPESVKLFGADCRKVHADLYIDDKAMLPGECERLTRFSRTVRRGK